MSMVKKISAMHGLYVCFKRKNLEVKYHLLITVNELAVKETARRKGSNCWDF